MIYEIKSRWDDRVLWSGEAETLIAALRAACASCANLRGADLRGADLRGADLSDANLSDADLRGADPRGANTNAIQQDLWSVLDAAPNEAPGLLSALAEGRVDGSCYEGECACLVGTLAKIRGCSYESIPGLQPDSTRPAECWFLSIRPGQTPANRPHVALTVEWIAQWGAVRGLQALAEQVQR